MALSFNQYPGDGSAQDFAITFQFLARDHITVREDGELFSGTVEWITDTTLRLTPAPADGSVVDIRRETPRDQLIVTFKDGSVLTETNLNASAYQSLFIAQEVFDLSTTEMTVSASGQWDAGDRRIENVADGVNPQDVATKDQLDDVVGDAQAAAEPFAIAASNDADSAAASALAAQNFAAVAEGHSNSASTHASNAAASAGTAASEATRAQEAADSIVRKPPKETRHTVNGNIGLDADCIAVKVEVFGAGGGSGAAAGISPNSGANGSPGGATSVSIGNVPTGTAQSCNIQGGLASNNSAGSTFNDAAFPTPTGNFAYWEPGMGAKGGRGATNNHQSSQDGRPGSKVVLWNDMEGHSGGTVGMTLGVGGAGGAQGGWFAGSPGQSAYVIITQFY